MKVTIEIDQTHAKTPCTSHYAMQHSKQWYEFWHETQPKCPVCGVPAMFTYEEQELEVIESRFVRMKSEIDRAL